MNNFSWYLREESHSMGQITTSLIIACLLGAALWISGRVFGAVLLAGLLVRLAGGEHFTQAMPPEVPIYVINLKRRPDRLRACLSRLPKKKKKDVVTVIDAVDGRDLDTATWKTRLTRGEIGCFLSHLQALDIIAHGRAPYGLVLEDDAVLDASIAHVQSLIQEAAPVGVDVIALGCNALPQEPHIRQVSRRLVALVGYDLYGTTAMVYSKRGARKILRAAQSTGFDIPYDVWLTKKCPAVLAVARPSVAHPSNIKDSETQKTR